MAQFLFQSPLQPLNVFNNFDFPMKCETTAAGVAIRTRAQQYNTICDFETLIFLSRQNQVREWCGIEITVKWQKLKGRTCSEEGKKCIHETWRTFHQISFSRNHHFPSPSSSSSSETYLFYYNCP